MSQWGARQREKGLCCKCTRPIAPHSKSRCEVHLQKLRDEDKRPRKGGRRILSAEARVELAVKNKKQNRVKARIRYRLKSTGGKCWWCNEMAVTGRSTCIAHESKENTRRPQWMTRS